MKTQQRTVKLKHTQTGSVMVLTMISLLVVMAIAGAGIDLGHAFVNKTRAQNLVDALALAGAKVLDSTAGSQAAANTEISALFDLNMAHSANLELSDRLDIGDITVQYSKTLDPFTSAPGAADTKYVRVAVNDINLQSWFIQLLSVSSTNVGASAVAGISPPIKNIICEAAPMMACGDPTKDPADNDPGVDQFWGYQPGVVQKLKSDSQNPADQCAGVGPGNFYLIDIGLGNGAAAVRTQMAGNLAGCQDVTNGIPTEPGNAVGPSSQGLNTRFNIYSGPMNGTQGTYPPDILYASENDHQADDAEDLAILENPANIDPETLQDICTYGTASALTYNHLLYQTDNVNGASDIASGEPYRRVLSIPIGDCDGDFSGKSEVPFLGMGCFFLLKEIGSTGNQSEVFGEFINGCTQPGALGPDPDDSNGPYKIILYKDAASLDS